MSTVSKIEWTERTWNPVTGCTKVSQGCKHCYAERMAKRLKAMGAARYSNGFQVTLHDDLLDLPKKWKAPATIFVNSMSDLFHESVPDDFIKRVFGTIAECQRHTFQILTKRSERLRQLAPSLPWPANAWMGVSVESPRVLNRVEDLRRVPAQIRFLSCEPLIARLSRLRLEKIDWVIVGGESGPRARPMDPDWVYEIRDLCADENVDFFFKQWGGVRKELSGRVLDGKTYDAMPLRAAEFAPTY